MNINCPNCGGQVAEGTPVCPICSYNFAASAPAPAPEMAPAVRPQSPIQKFLPLGIGVVAVVLVIVLIFTLFGGGGASSALDLDEEFNNGDYSNYEDTRPGIWIDKYIEEALKKDKNFDYDKDLQEDIAEKETAWKAELAEREEEYGEGCEFSISNVVEFDVDEDRFEAIQDGVHEKYDIAREDITDAKQIFYIVTLEGDKKAAHDNSSTYAVKIDGDWFLCSSNGSLRYLSY